MNTDYLEASPQSRRRFVLLFVVALVIGLVIIELLEAHLERVWPHLSSHANSPGQLRKVAGICCVGLFGDKSLERIVNLAFQEG